MNSHSVSNANRNLTYLDIKIYTPKSFVGMPYLELKVKTLCHEKLKVKNIRRRRFRYMDRIGFY